MQPTAFISGHRNLSPEEFACHYAPAITQAYTDGCRCFIMGDYEGADALCQAFVADNFPDATLVVYHMFSTPRHVVTSALLVGGFADDESRDAAMTEASTMDIAWVRPGKEQSGTAQNLARRKDPNARVYRAESAAL